MIYHNLPQINALIENSPKTCQAIFYGALVPRSNLAQIYLTLLSYPLCLIDSNAINLKRTLDLV